MESLLGQTTYGDKVQSMFNRIKYGPGYFNYTTETGVNSGVIQYLYYFLAITLIIIVILVLVHFTFRPIFITRPGSSGIIPLPGSDDSKVYWKRSETALVTLKPTETPLGSLFQNYSMMLDIHIDNPTANTNTPRVLFIRGEPNKTDVKYSANDTIMSLNDKFNLILFLERMTNDLNIAIQTVNTGGQIILENIVIPNIPVGKTVRIGVMVGTHVLEVYVNGYLAKSKAFTNSVRSIVGNIIPPDDAIQSSTARVSNLRLWARPLTPSEFRAYKDVEQFERKQVADSCAA